MWLQQCEPAAPVTTNLTYCVGGDTAAAITTAVTATGTLSWYSDAAGTVSIMISTISTRLTYNILCNSHKRKLL
jgi:hypothetical protein